jgi:hypothetical protein
VNSAKARLDRSLTEDHVRLLLQSAVIVRFANKFLDSYKVKKNFVLVVVYIGSDGMATYYLLFQTEKDYTVCFTTPCLNAFAD